jgi:hypothetical protein
LQKISFNLQPKRQKIGFIKIPQQNLTTPTQRGHMTIGYFFAVLRASFYSRDFYRAVGSHWKGYGIGYLAGAIALSWFVIITVWMATILPIDVHPTQKELAVNSGITDDKASPEKQTLSAKLQAIIAQIPLITIEKGKASVAAPQPYTIYLPQTNTPLAIIDTTGKTTSLSGTGAMILLTKEELLLPGAEPTQESHYTIADFTDNDTVVIDHAMIYDWLARVKKFILWFMPLVIFPAIVLFSLLQTLVRAFFYAILGLAFARTQNISLNFPSIMRLSVISSIPVTLLSTLPTIFPVLAFLPYKWLLFFIIAISYLFYAVHVNQEADTDTAEAPTPHV